MKRASTFLLTVVQLAMVTSQSHAQNTTAIGGYGGTAFTATCPDGQVLIGLSVWKGSWLDSVTGVCAKVSIANGSWSTTTSMAEYGTMPMNTNPANKQYRPCASGYAIKGYKGTAATYVHGITLRCERLGSSARTIGDATFLASMGGPGGNAYSPYTCPDAKPAIGIYGRAGTYVDRFGLVCGYIMPTTPVLTAPPNGVQVTAPRPRFDWDAADRMTHPYRICINVVPIVTCSISGGITAAVPIGTTDWTPAYDLPYLRGAVVHWRVEACNENGCKAATKKFQFVP